MNVNTPLDLSTATGRTRLSRRNLLSTVAIVPAVALLLAACGDRNADSGSDDTNPGTTPASTVDTGVPTTTGAPVDTASPTTTEASEPSPGSDLLYPTDPDAVVLSIGTEGGFVTQQYNFTRQPSLLITGDGRVFTPAPITLQYPGPMVMPINVQTISPEGIQAILRFAQSTGLLGTIPDYSSPNEMEITDLPNDVVVLEVNGERYVHSAYALGIGEDEEHPEEYPARVALRGFIDALTSLETVAGTGTLGEAEAFVPTEYRVTASAYGDDTSDVEAELLTWPEAAGIDLADVGQCSRVPAEAISSLVADAREDAMFSEDGTIYQVSIAAVLPSDGECAPTS